MKYLYILFFVGIGTQFTFAQNIFQEAFSSRNKSTKENIRIQFSDDFGNTGNLPISIINGKTQGPVFTIISGVHGYEYPPIIATQEILKEIDTEKLKGTLIVVPIANLASFYARSPFVNPQDQKNLNNVFPGKKKGSITEKIAAFITTNIIAVSDLFLDIHGGDAPEDLLPFICYYDNQKNQKKQLWLKS